MNRYLHVSFVWNETPKGMDQLTPIFSLAEDWVTYGNDFWILYTSESIYTWQGRIIAVIDKSKDSCFVCEIANIKQSGGWLPAWVWDWIKKDRLAVAQSLTTPNYLKPLIGPPK